MKLVITVFAIFLSLSCFAQENPCSKRLDVVGSLFGGSPYYTGVEAGVMGFGQRIALFAGVQNYNTPIPGKQDDTQSHTTPYVRLSYTMIREGDIRAYLTTFYGINGIYGYTMRLGYVLSDNVQLCLEPGYTKVNRFGAGLCLMARF